MRWRWNQAALALLPTAVVLIWWRFLPRLLASAPASIFYPCVFLSVLIGGLIPGLITTTVFTLYQGLVLKPSIMMHPTQDLQSVVRVTMFATTSLFFTVLVASLRRSRAKARRDREHLQLALDSAKIGAWDLDLRTGSMTCDDEALRSFDQPSGQHVFSAALLRDWIHTDDRAKLLSSIRESHAARTRFREEVRLERPDQEPRWLSVSGAPLIESSGEPHVLLGTVVDITERKDLEKELRRAIRVRDDFLSIASHELKSPLTALKLQLQLLLHWTTNPTEVALPSDRLVELLARSNNQLDRLTLLINDLLDVTRASRGVLTISPRSLDASALLVELLQSLQNLAGAAKTAIHVDVQSGIHAIWDRQRIEQLVSNLVNNGLKYGAGSPVNVSFHLQDQDAYLSVKDYGSGIDPKDHARIFERFERVPSTSAQSGLGLGLFICKEIARAHHGRIWVESEPGQGTEFIVKLPLRADASGTAH